MLNLKLLNKEQYKAVTNPKNKAFIVAGAGCGKTRVLTYRIAYLLEKGVPESDIYAFTFTNKAANEMKNRLEELLQRQTKVSLSTFHSYCLTILKSFPEYVDYYPHFMIIDEDDKKKVIKDIIKELNLPITDKDASLAISKYKDLSSPKLKTIEEKLQYLKVFYEYQNTLKQTNRMDYDDMLYQFYNLLINSNWIKEGLQEMTRYILVDECQDINKIQYQIILKLSEIHQNIFMVGDEDQCIYSFRGSDISSLKHFTETLNAEVIKLEQNYRSSKNILEAANSVIKKNQNRIDKTLYTNYQDKNFKLVVANLESDIDEANYIVDLIKALVQKGYTYKDFAVLYRNNQTSVQIEKALLKEKIPFYIIGGLPFFRRKEIKLLINYLLFLINPNDDISLSYIINTPARGIGQVLQKQINDISKQKRISLYNSIKTLSNESKNEPLINFLNLINQLQELISSKEPEEFLKELIKELDYFNVLRKEQNSKKKINNVYALLEMIKTDNNLTPKMKIIEFINNLYLDATKENEKGYIKLMTIHQAKGLEYKIVILAGCNNGLIPSTKTNIDEERRVFYVAITRAKERLYLLSGRRRLTNGEYKDYQISPFILDIENSLINFN